MKSSVGKTLSSNEGPTNSASLAEAQRKIEKLEQENLHLRAEVLEVRSSYNQLVHECSHEKFDERRVNFLKAQLIQLERQVLIFSESLSQRAAILLEVENALVGLADICRHHITMETVGPVVAIQRSELIRMVETIESSRIKLFKHIENSSVDKLAKPLILMDKFIKTGIDEEVTMMDLCSGRLEHLNLRHVSRLESKLSELYRETIRVYELINMMVLMEGDIPVFDTHLPSVTLERAALHMATLCNSLKECSDDLLALSVLIPSAPWPPLQKHLPVQLTTEKVIAALPNFPRSKQEEGKQLVDALCKACSFTHYMDGFKCQALQEELSYHKATHQLLHSYAESLFQAVRTSYQSFEDDMNELLCRPLENALSSFVRLSTTASEDDLRAFLMSFKDNAEQLKGILESLQRNQTSKEGQTAVSSFSEQFFQSLEKLKYECKVTQDKAALELDAIKTERESYDIECKKLFKPKVQPDNKEMYEQIVSTDENVISSEASTVQTSDNLSKTGNPDSCTCIASETSTPLDRNLHNPTKGARLKTYTTPSRPSISSRRGQNPVNKMVTVSPATVTPSRNTNLPNKLPRSGSMTGLTINKDKTISTPPSSVKRSGSLTGMTPNKERTSTPPSSVRRSGSLTGLTPNKEKTNTPPSSVRRSGSLTKLTLKPKSTTVSETSNQNKKH